MWSPIRLLALACRLLLTSQMLFSGVSKRLSAVFEEAPLGGSFVVSIVAVATLTLLISVDGGACRVVNRLTRQSGVTAPK